MDTLEKTELTASILNIARFLKSEISIYNSEVPETAGKTNEKMEKKNNGNCKAFFVSRKLQKATAKSIVPNKWKCLFTVLLLNLFHIKEVISTLQNVTSDKKDFLKIFKIFASCHHLLDLRVSLKQIEKNMSYHFTRILFLKGFTSWNYHILMNFDTFFTNF